MEIDFKIYIQHSTYNKYQITDLLNKVGFNIILGSSREFIPSNDSSLTKLNLNYNLDSGYHITFINDSGTNAKKYFGLESIHPILDLYPYHQEIVYYFEVEGFENIDFESIFKKIIQLIRLIPENLAFSFRITINHEFVLLVKQEEEFRLFKEEEYDSYDNGDAQYKYFLQNFLKASVIFKKELFSY